MLLQTNDAGELVLPPELVQAPPHTAFEVERQGSSVVVQIAPNVPESGSVRQYIAQQKVMTSSTIASMTNGVLIERYHGLVDEDLRRELTTLERFELESIEARLEVEDRDLSLEASDRNWELRRADLLDSIANLVGTLKAWGI